MTTIRATLTVSMEEAVRIEDAATRDGRPIDDVCSELLSKAVHLGLLRTLTGVPDTRPRHVEPRRETQSEKRARLRAESPDGMSPYTRELQTIRPTTKENHA